MDFGRLDDISRVDFTLPSDRFTPALLWGGKPSASPRVFVGAPSWGVKDWVGKVYPPKTSAQHFLHAYARQYNTIELNATRYKIPSAEQTRTWASQAPAEFQFCPKFPDEITHNRHLRNSEALTETFLDSLTGFGDKIGPSLLQLPPSFGVRQAHELFGYLRMLEGCLSYALELRHPSWFSDRAALADLRAYLVGQQQSLVLTDVAGRRDVLHMAPTSLEVFIRWAGYSLHPSDYARLDAWAERLAEWMGQGLETIYFFVHQPGETFCPEAASHFIRKLNSLTNLGMKDATYYNRDLFSF